MTNFNFTLAITFLFFSCGEQSETSKDLKRAEARHSTASATIKDTITQRLERNNQDEIFVYPCAIITEPTNEQIDSLKKVYSKEDFSRIVDDNINYISNARELFTSKGVKMIDKKPIGKVTFRKKDGSITDMEISQFLWGVVLFNGKSDAIEADFTTIEEEYNRYMK